MGSCPCSKGFYLFLLWQMSLPLCLRGQGGSTTAVTGITVFGTDATMVTDGPTFTNSSLTSNSSNSTNSTSMTPLNVNGTSNWTVPSSGNELAIGYVPAGSNSTNTSALFCRVLTCNTSMCYNTFMSANSTLCPATAKFCELRREDTMTYSVKCATTCPTFCTNVSQTNCSVDCCSSETCLNSTVNNLLNYTMSMTSTTQTTTTNATKATTLGTTTAPNNGKKCHKISCTGDICYQGNTNVVLCSPTLNYCMLKRALTGTVMTWTGGCSEDCRKETACSSTAATCFLECCNATSTASCLKLTGAVNMPSSATRGLFSPMLLMASSLLLWLISMATSA